MSIWKLVSGILSIVLAVFVLFQSCAAGLSNTIESNGESGGSAGFFVALLMIAGGIVSIATRKSEQLGSIAVFIIDLLAALLGFLCAGSYTDLNVWAVWCLLCSVVAIIGFVTGKLESKKEKESEGIYEKEN